MRDPFDERKATQAASLFLRLADGRMNYMVLIKLLYLLDRFGLVRWGHPVIFDDYFSMHDGPMVSHVHDLITEMPWPEEVNLWNKFISPPSNYEVKLLHEAGTDELSEAEVELISELFAEYGHYDDPWDLVHRLHKELGEWRAVEKGQRLPIKIADILGTERMPPEEIRAIEDELESLRYVRSFLVRR